MLAAAAHVGSSLTDWSRRRRAGWRCLDSTGAGGGRAGCRGSARAAAPWPGPGWDQQPPAQQALVPAGRQPASTWLAGTAGAPSSCLALASSGQARPLSLLAALELGAAGAAAGPQEGRSQSTWSPCRAPAGAHPRAGEGCAAVLGHFRFPHAPFLTALGGQDPGTAAPSSEEQAGRGIDTHATVPWPGLGSGGTRAGWARQGRVPKPGSSPAPPALPWENFGGRGGMGAPEAGAAVTSIGSGGILGCASPQKTSARRASATLLGQRGSLPFCAPLHAGAVRGPVCWGGARLGSEPPFQLHFEAPSGGPTKGLSKCGLPALGLRWSPRREDRQGPGPPASLVPLVCPLTGSSGCAAVSFPGPSGREEGARDVGFPSSIWGRGGSQALLS